MLKCRLIYKAERMRSQSLHHAANNIIAEDEVSLSHVSLLFLAVIESVWVFPPLCILFHFAFTHRGVWPSCEISRKIVSKNSRPAGVCSYVHEYYFEQGKKHSRVTSSIFAYPRRTAGLLARTVEWGHRGVRRRRVESIKTSRRQVRSDPPGKFKRTFHRVVITRIRVARASAVTLPKSFSWPRLSIPWRSEAWPSSLEFIAFNGAQPLTAYHLLPDR